jgi:hypothetical protein
MDFSKVTTISMHLRESSLTILAATIRSTKYMLKPEDDTGGGGREKITLPTEGKTNFPPAHAELDANNLTVTCQTSPHDVPKSPSRTLLPLPISQLIWCVGLTLMLES